MDRTEVFVVRFRRFHADNFPAEMGLLCELGTDKLRCEGPNVVTVFGFSLLPSRKNRTNIGSVVNLG